jgi:hypothetical protein
VVKVGARRFNQSENTLASIQLCFPAECIQLIFDAKFSFREERLKLMKYKISGKALRTQLESTTD